MSEEFKNNEIFKVVLFSKSKTFYNMLVRLFREYFSAELIYLNEFTNISIRKVSLIKGPFILLVDIEKENADTSFLQRLRDNFPKTDILVFPAFLDSNAKYITEKLDSISCFYIEKPSDSVNLKLFKEALVKKVDLMEKSDFQKRGIEKKLSSDEEDDSLEEKRYINKPLALALGCSTGGVEALTEVLRNFKKDSVNIPVFVTQHMPSEFVESLVRSISSASGLFCKEAEHGERVLPGVVYVAKGDHHMQFLSRGIDVFINLVQTEEENFCRPAVDPMLVSLAEIYKGNLIVIILTGMGKDSVKGCREVFNAGGYIIIQDEESSKSWGMPGSVFKEGIYTEMLPLKKIGKKILKICKL